MVEPKFRTIRQWLNRSSFLFQQQTDKKEEIKPISQTFGVAVQLKIPKANPQLIHSIFPHFSLFNTHTHTHTSKKERRKKQTQIPKHSKWQLKIHLIFFHFQQNYLIYKDAEKTQCTGQAAICPLHQKEEQVCGRTIRQPHLQACSIVVSRKLGSSATQ